jgi:phosphohistidine swiveling domain-containing protein
MSQIAALIARAARHFGDRPCLIEGARTLSFTDLDRETRRFASAMLGLGLAHGDRVGVLLPNGIDALVAYYGLARAGLVRVSLNTRETADDHRYKLSDSGASAVLVAADWGDVGVDAIPPERLAILLRPTTSPEDVPAMMEAAAVVTAEGGATSHAAVVGRALGKPVVTGCGSGILALAGRPLTVCGSSGRVFEGQFPLAPPAPGPDLRTYRRWAEEAGDEARLQALKACPW